MSPTFDVVVIGSGPGGYRAAVLAALRGLDVAIIEGGEWGGCCLNRGCVPKKAWHHTAQLLARQSGFSRRGIKGHLGGDLQAAWQHQRDVVAGIREGYTSYLERLGVSRIVGHGRFIAANRVEVRGPQGVRAIQTRRVVVATGSTPKIPEGLQLIPGRIITTDMLFEQPAPAGERVVVLGSGVAATELSFILTMLCGEVTWLGRSRFLRRQPFSAPARRALTDAMERQGVHLQQNASPIRISDHGKEGLLIESNDGTKTRADWICVATGRRPVTQDLGLAEVGVQTDASGFIVRDDWLETTVPGVYAIGDCASREMTANHALADATVVIDNIAHGNRRRDDLMSVPTVVYSATEIARIGLDEDSAEDLDLEPAVGFAAFETNPCALGRDERDGFVRILADLDTGHLLGGEIVGSGAGELIHLLSLAPNPDTALAWLASGRYNHPTMAEEVLNASETLAARWGLTDVVFGARETAK